VSDKSIFLAVPHYGAIVPDALPSLCLPSVRHRVLLNTNCASLLAHNFNRLWCTALNERQDKCLTHFAMHHADIAAPAGWLDVLLEEMERVGADVISCIVPIKDARGLTSTGLQDPETGEITRFTMKQVLQLPETFDAAGLGSVHHLMVNTGLWVCDFGEAWVEQVCFEIRDRITRGTAGRYIANALPEDWNFSAWCARQGLKVFATRKVPVSHHGTAVFKNDSGWGEWHSDQGDRQ
jgi:hypothetical protein